MNIETQELVKQYIEETLKDVNGVPSGAFKLLEHMMKVDRHLASLLHDVYEQSISSGNRYFIPADDFIN
jgi:hypothetical protein